MLIKVDELVTHFVMMCYTKYSVDESEYVMYKEILRSDVDFLYSLGGVTSYHVHKKIRNSVAASTVPVTEVTHTFIQEPVFSAHRMRCHSDASRSLTRLASLVSSRIFFRHDLLP